MENFAAGLSDDKKKILEQTLQNWNDMIRSPEFTTTEWKGYVFMPGFEAGTAKYVYEEWDGPSDGDIVVVAFPKTGTNWTYEIARQILYKNNPEHDKISRSIPPPLLGLESGPGIKYQLWENIDLPRNVVFSHLPRELFNNEKFRNAKIIYVARNPKDQMVSYFHFVRKFAAINNPQIKEIYSSNWGEFFASCMAGRPRLETKEGEWYLEHLSGWYDTVMEDENKMFIFYEDMKRDLPSAVRKLSKFLGVELSEEDISDISSSCEIENMKKRAKAVESEFNKVQNELEIIRKGAVGEWKNYFTVAQSEMMDAMVEKKIGHLGIKFTYEL